MGYRTSRQDRAAQVNLERGRRRKPVYRFVLGDDQRASLAASNLWPYDADTDNEPPTDAVVMADAEADALYWRLMDEATQPTPRPATATDDPDDDMPF